LTALVGEGYLEVLDILHGVTVKTRFLDIMMRLPVELRMVLCNRLYRYSKMFVPSHLVKKFVFKELEEMANS